MRTPKPKPMTAHEFLAQRPNGPPDPAVRARLAREQDERRRRELEYTRAAAPLVADLRTVGWDVTSVWDLVNIDEPYPEALPVLIRHLVRPYPSVIRDGIARALGVRQAIFAWDLLREQYVAEQDPQVKDGIAVALANMVDREHLDDLLGLLRDRRHGQRRLLLLRGLQRLRDPRARAALEELADDPDLHKQIEIILRRRRKRRGRSR
jgi:HEAT repeat protein